MSSTPTTRPSPSSDLRLAALGVEEYVRDVFPDSFALWAGRRTPAQYAEEWRAIAHSGYGRRRIRTFGLFDGSTLVASFKRYERDARIGSRPMRAFAIGAVFTPPRFRGRGYASAMLSAALAGGRDAGFELALLFSDIDPAFYEALGFVALPSRVFSARTASLTGARIATAALDGARDAAAMRRCFGAIDAARPLALKRTPLVWSWNALRATSRENDGVRVTIGVRRGDALDAYVAGRRIPHAGAFVVDEAIVAADRDPALLPALLRAAAGNADRITGWLPPAVESTVPRAAIRARRDAIAMIAPLSPDAKAAWRRNAVAVTTSATDPFWAADHV